MRKLELDRRTLLRGALGGATISVGLPALEIFFDAPGRARAASAGFPKRFGLFYWGNGNVPDRWTPTGEGDQWELSEELEPLRQVKDEITVVSGMSVLTGNAIPHHSGTAGILSGAPLITTGDDHTFSGPSVDQIIAGAIGGETRFRSIEAGVRPEGGVSFNGPNSRNPTESSPRRLFNRLFGGGFQVPGSDPIVDPKLGLRRSVLDVVMRDAERLRGRLGATDKQRLEQHLGSVRELERRIARLEEDPPNLQSCALPPEPAEGYADVEGRPQISALNRAIADVLVMALACDQTRVFSHVLSGPLSGILYEGKTAGHHRLTHDEPGNQPQVNDIVKTIMGELRVLIEALKAVPEGNGTLLDNCAILATTEVSWGREHRLDEFPIILAGTACGALKKGIHYRSPSQENASKVIFSLLQAMDVRVGEFGAGGGKVDQGLGAIEV